MRWGYCGKMHKVATYAIVLRKGALFEILGSLLSYYEIRSDYLQVSLLDWEPLPQLVTPNYQAPTPPHLYIHIFRLYITIHKASKNNLSAVYTKYSILPLSSLVSSTLLPLSIVRNAGRKAVHSLFYLHNAIVPLFFVSLFCFFALSGRDISSSRFVLVAQSTLFLNLEQDDTFYSCT